VRTDERAEQHFFLEVKQDRPVYCVQYIPEKDHDKRLGVILCKPIWGERIRTHRIFTNLGRMLRSEGFTVITCDYYGDGNSGGDTLDLNFFGMVEDLETLCCYLERKYHLEKFALVGLRIGANCAIEAEKRIPGLTQMILFEPIPNPVEDLTVRLRANLSTQMAVHKKILKNRTVLVEEIKSGIPVNMDGFLIGKELWESFEQVSPLAIDSNFTGPVKIISLVEKNRKWTDFSKLAANYKNGSTIAVQREFIWTDLKYYIPKPPIFFETVKSELDTLK
jgi:alpha/beta superfamily hydrolase